MLILKVILLSIVLIAFSFLAMAVQVIIKGRFPKTAIGHNSDMRKLGITCAKCDELKACAISKKKAKTLA